MGDHQARPHGNITQWPPPGSPEATTPRQLPARRPTTSRQHPGRVEVLPWRAGPGPQKLAPGRKRAEGSFAPGPHKNMRRPSFGQKYRHFMPLFIKSPYLISKFSACGGHFSSLTVLAESGPGIFSIAGRKDFWKTSTLAISPTQMKSLRRATEVPASLLRCLANHLR